MRFKTVLCQYSGLTRFRFWVKFQEVPLPGPASRRQRDQPSPLADRFCL